MSDRLDRQIRFLVEIDQLKRVLRQTPITGGSRPENSAEHSWHLAMMAVLLSEYAPAGADLSRALRMVLVHDLVEIDAGDTFCYDAAASVDKEARERRAALRLFGLLPEEQASELHALWEEFEEMRTPAARFATALDRLQPLLLNLHTGGGSWRVHGVRREQVMQRMEPIRAGIPDAWPFVEDAVRTAAEQGWLR